MTRAETADPPAPPPGQPARTCVRVADVGLDGAGWVECFADPERAEAYAARHRSWCDVSVWDEPAVPPS